MLSTQTMIAWYYVGVMVLLFAGQTYLLNTAHKEAVTKLTASYEQKLKDAGMPDAAKVVSQAAPAAPAAAPVARSVVASPAPQAVAEPAPVAKASDAAAIRTLVTSPAKEPARPSSSQASASKSLPAVPVKVAFRSEPFRKGKIVVVTNTSKQERAYTLNVRRPSTGEKESFEIKVPPAAETRFVGDGAWAFREGDRLLIALSGHAPQVHEIP